MHELSDELYDSIMDDLERGDDLSEKTHFKTALVNYQRGLDKVPNPKADWEIALHLYTALGDCYFNLGEYEVSNDSYNQALKCPDALDNGYVWLGLGQSYYELDDKEKAKDALMSAYMLEGNEIFEEQDEKYFELIKQYVGEDNIPDQDSESDNPQGDLPRSKNRPPGTTWS
ncbi:tetratricopeptide repeat protein, partial [Testudinibacter aquarius]